MGQLNRITSVAQCYAHAIAIEHEAVKRYTEFAELLEEQGNDQTARLFRNLAKLEVEHEAVLTRRTGSMVLPVLETWQYSWLDDASPECVNHDLVFHLMTPWHALKIAEGAERRALAFFEQVATSAPDADVRKIAREMASEEGEHVKWIGNELARTPRPPATDTMIPSAFFD